jgi:hypothetical protein
MLRQAIDGHRIRPKWPWYNMMRMLLKETAPDPGWGGGKNQYCGRHLISGGAPNCASPALPKPHLFGRNKDCCENL